jgi:tRNA (mo5U34)-methyltransferase
VKTTGGRGSADSMRPEICQEAWYHTIDLPDGTSTPGVFDSRRTAGLVQWPVGLRGGRCLDVGTCDGFWAFEMERRGAAEVIAIDVDDLDQLDWSMKARDSLANRDWGKRRGRRFGIARRALGSRVERLGCSVYELDRNVHGRFDVVFCGTLLPHLRDPVRALERIAEVCAGELVLVECLDARLDVIAPRLPCARFAPAPEQWWRINGAGLLSLLRVAGFDVLWVSRRFVTPFGTGALRRHGDRRGLVASSRRLAASVLRTFQTTPILAGVAGLAFGTYDVAVRARPRQPGKPDAHPGNAAVDHS